MPDFDLVKIGDVADYRREFIEISDTEEYKRCRVQLHKKGVVLRDIIKGSDIKTKKQRLCKTNDFIVAEMDAKFGGYGIIPESLNNAIVSSHYYLFEFDQNKILSEYLKVLIDTDVIQSQIKAKGTTNYSRVSPKEILNFEIPCPSIDVQKKIIRKYINSKKHVINILKEYDTQQFFLKQLRQAILQEAVEGKLTAEWRKKHPELISGENHAARLLEKIKAEKEKLTKNTKRTKKLKELPPITDAEKPFELPEGWVWCRLIDYGVTQTGTTPSTTYKSNFGNFIPFIKPADISTAGINYFNEGLSELGLSKGRLIDKDSILMVCIGGSLGKSYFTDRSVSCNQQINALTPVALINVRFLQNFLQSNYFQNEVWDKAMKSSTPIINKRKWEEIPLPLPPLAEQQAIVEKVDRLMAKIDLLEEQVKARKKQAEQLMQAVLREAFNGKYAKEL